MIIGHGIDLVEVARIGLLIETHGERFLDRCFTIAERRYCDRSSRRKAEHYAARFAAKEAVLKALGTGWRGGIAWTDIEVTREPQGRPGIRLVGRSREIAEAAGVSGWLLSLTHTNQYAAASAIAVGEPHP